MTAKNTKNQLWSGTTKCDKIFKPTLMKCGDALGCASSWEGGTRGWGGGGGGRQVALQEYVKDPHLMAVLNRAEIKTPACL